MQTAIRSIAFTAAAVAISGAANAAVVTAKVTADNHYAVYAGVNGSVVYIGGNETGTAGSTGGYNWSKPETWTFDAYDAIYVAAWSDDAVAQGLLGEFTIDGQRVVTGHSGWEVFATGIDLDTNSPHPTAIDLHSQVMLADAGGLWGTPQIYRTNTSAATPWGKVAGIGEDASWVWASAPQPGISTLIGGKDWDEYLIFRYSDVPAPGAAGVLAIAGLCAMRRRRC